MKMLNIKKVLIGINATATLIGIGLIGLTFGHYVKTGVAMYDHVLFNAAMSVLAAGMFGFLTVFFLGFNKSDETQK